MDFREQVYDVISPFLDIFFLFFQTEPFKLTELAHMPLQTPVST